MKILTSIFIILTIVSIIIATPKYPITYFFAGVTLVAAIVTTIVVSHEYYPMCGTITDINTNEDYFIITDFNGENWIYEGIEDWQIDDIVACIMDNKGTLSIKDDSIVKIKYCGY